MKTIQLKVGDETADELLKRYGGIHLDPKTGQVFRNVPTPISVVDMRASRAEQHVIRVREFDR